MIRESIVTSQNPNGEFHIAPMGIHERNGLLVLAPFKPSITLENVMASRCAVINYTDDVRVFAGCITGRKDWPVKKANEVNCVRLSDCLAHTEVEVVEIEEDDIRPRLLCRQVIEQMHAPFHGFNRAQAAVLELAILVSRLDRLPGEKIERDIAYLKIAIEKTASFREQEAWNWLMAAVENFRQANQSLS